MKGFTLIELMVAVSVGLVVTGMIIVNYNSYNTTQQLKQAALTLKNNIRFIETKAASGVKPSGSCTSLTGWNMTFSANGYTYGANCNGVAAGTTTTVTFPSGVTLTSLPSQNPIVFYVLSRGTNLNASATITLSGASKNYEVVIGKNGDVSDNGIQ